VAILLGRPSRRVSEILREIPGEKEDTSLPKPRLKKGKKKKRKECQFLERCLLKKEKIFVGVGS